MDTDLNLYRSNDYYTEIFVWGSNKLGQIGLSSKKSGKLYSIPRFCTFKISITQISCGVSHSAFITNKGNIYSIGSNLNGELGIGHKGLLKSCSPTLVEDLINEKALKVSCGGGHTLVLMENGDVYSWGNGEEGQLGLNSKESKFLPNKLLFNNKNIKIIELSAGYNHSFIITNQFLVLSFGGNTFGQLGNGTKQKQLIPQKIANITHNIIKISCGYNFTLLLDDNGKIYSCGDNSLGQLGLGKHIINSPIPILIKSLDEIQIIKITGGKHSAAISNNGELYSWGMSLLGNNFIPKLVIEQSSNKKKPNYNSIKAKKFINVAIGGNFGIAMTSNSELYAWGANTYGELGLGDFKSRMELCQIGYLIGKKVLNFSCGETHVMAIGQNIPSYECIYNSGDGFMNEDSIIFEEFRKVETPLRRKKNILDYFGKNKSSNDLFNQKPGKKESVDFELSEFESKKLREKEFYLMNKKFEMNKKEKENKNFEEIKIKSNSLIDFSISKNDKINEYLNDNYENNLQNINKSINNRISNNNSINLETPKSILQNVENNNKKESLLKNEDNEILMKDKYYNELIVLSKQNELLQKKMDEITQLINILKDENKESFKNITSENENEEERIDLNEKKESDEKIVYLTKLLFQKERKISEMQLEFSKREIIEQAFISKIDYMKEIIDLKNKEIQFLKQS